MLLLLLILPPPPDDNNVVESKFSGCDRISCTKFVDSDDCSSFHIDSSFDDDGVVGIVGVVVALLSAAISPPPPLQSLALPSPTTSTTNCALFVLLFS